MIEAKVIKDSTVKLGGRLISIETKAPKFLDAEIEKHRMISSNSSSSRAIPTNKISSTPFLPLDVRKEQKGMQGYEALDEENLKRFYHDLIVLYRQVKEVTSLWAGTVHKQHLNRYLEPFTIQTKIMTATEEVWEYFLGLRCAEDADPNIQFLANEIKKAINNSIPQKLKVGEWHLPYIDSVAEEDRDISAARCARTSYKTHEGKEPSIDADLNLAKFLLKAKHLTPFEHQASPPSVWDRRFKPYMKEASIYSGNFKGWNQYRQEIE